MDEPMKTDYPATPELDKLHANKEGAQRIGAFLDWLLNERCPHTELRYLCEDPEKESEDWLTETKSIEALLAEYFEIDLEKVDAEKQAILDHLQAQHNA